MLQPQKYLRLSVLLFIFLIQSCSKEVELDLSVDSPKLVLNCLLTPQKPVSVNLSSSSSVLETIFPEIEDAQITLFENGQFVANLTHVSEGDYQTDFKPKAGMIYTITAEAAGFKPVTAMDSMPLHRPVIYDYSFNYPGKVVGESIYGRITIRISDQEPEKINYYEITFSSFENFCASNDVVTVNDCDPPYPRTILFTDRSFSGKTINFILYVNKDELPEMEVRSVSCNYYTYKKAWYTHVYTQAWGMETIDDLFKGEPTMMFSNIENGYGIFASYDVFPFDSRF